jgi:hypothetical protein
MGDLFGRIGQFLAPQPLIHRHQRQNQHTSINMTPAPQVMRQHVERRTERVVDNPNLVREVTTVRTLDVNEPDEATPLIESETVTIPTDSGSGTSTSTRHLVTRLKPFDGKGAAALLMKRNRDNRNTFEGSVMGARTTETATVSAPAAVPDLDGRGTIESTSRYTKAWVQEELMLRMEKISSPIYEFLTLVAGVYGQPVESFLRGPSPQDFREWQRVGHDAFSNVDDARSARCALQAVVPHLSTEIAGQLVTKTMVKSSLAERLRKEMPKDASPTELAAFIDGVKRELQLERTLLDRERQEARELAWAELPEHMGKILVESDVDGVIKQAYGDVMLVSNQRRKDIGMSKLMYQGGQVSEYFSQLVAKKMQLNDAQSSSIGTASAAQSKRRRLTGGNGQYNGSRVTAVYVPRWQYKNVANEYQKMLERFRTLVVDQRGVIKVGYHRHRQGSDMRRATGKHWSGAMFPRLGDDGGGDDATSLSVLI